MAEDRGLLHDSKDVPMIVVRRSKLTYLIHITMALQASVRCYEKSKLKMYDKCGLYHISVNGLFDVYAFQKMARCRCNSPVRDAHFACVTFAKEGEIIS